MDEFDLVRIALFGVCTMVSLVTFIKQARLAGVFGTSNKLISLGVLFLSGGFLSQSIYDNLGSRDPTWHSIIQLVLLMMISLGLGLIFFGLWKVTIFFDELHAKAAGSSEPQTVEKISE